MGPLEGVVILLRILGVTSAKVNSQLLCEVSLYFFDVEGKPFWTRLSEACLFMFFWLGLALGIETIMHSEGVFLGQTGFFPEQSCNGFFPTRDAKAKRNLAAKLASLHWIKKLLTGGVSDPLDFPICVFWFVVKSVCEGMVEGSKEPSNVAFRPSKKKKIMPQERKLSLSLLLLFVFLRKSCSHFCLHCSSL